MRTSVIAKCESLTCRIATARKAAARIPAVSPATRRPILKSTTIVSVPATRDETAREEQMVRARQRGIERQRAPNPGGRGVERGERVEGQGRPVKEVRVEIAAENRQCVYDGRLFVRPRPQVRQPEPDREQPQDRAETHDGRESRHRPGDEAPRDRRPPGGGADSGDSSGPITATRAGGTRSGVQVAGEERDAAPAPERMLAGKDFLLDPIRRAEHAVDVPDLARSFRCWP